VLIIFDLYKLIVEDYKTKLGNFKTAYYGHFNIVYIYNKKLKAIKNELNSKKKKELILHMILKLFVFSFFSLYSVFYNTDCWVLDVKTSRHENAGKEIYTEKN